MHWSADVKLCSVSKNRGGTKSAFPLAVCMLVGHGHLWTDIVDKTQKAAQQIRPWLGTWRWKRAMYLFSPKSQHGVMSKCGWIQACPFAWPLSPRFVVSYPDAGVFDFYPKHTCRNHAPAVMRELLMTATGNNCLCSKLWRRHTDALKACLSLPSG